MQYKGGFVDGLEEGQGVQTDKDGNRFEGFSNREKEWSFVETDKDGKVIKKEHISSEDYNRELWINDSRLRIAWPFFCVYYP